MYTRQLSKLIIYSLSVILSFNVYLDGDSTEDDSSGFFQQVVDNTKGELKASYFSNFDQDPRGDDKNFGHIDLKLNYKQDISDNVFLNVVGRFREDTANRTRETFGFVEDSDRPYLATIDELVFRYSGEKIEWSVGKQLFTWGVADTFRPTDQINPSDYTDLPTSEKLAVPAITLFHSHEKVDIQGVIIPAFTPTRLPGSDNRWGPDQSGLAAGFAPLFGGVTPNLDFSRREIPDKKLDTLQGGIRLTSSSLISGWDLGLTWYTGYDPIGVYRANIIPGVTPTVEMIQVFSEFQEFGASFSTTLKGAVVYGEGAFHITKDNLQEDSYFEYVLGFNYTNYDILSSVFEEIRFIVEYAGESVFDERTDNQTYFDTGQYLRPFQNSILWGIIFKHNIDTEFTFGGAYNINDGDALISPQLSHKLQNGMKIITGFDIFTGNDDSFFGRWDNNDRFSLTVEYLF